MVIVSTLTAQPCNCLEIGLSGGSYHHYTWNLCVLVKYQGHSMGYQAYSFYRLIEKDLSTD